jgi:hypothetical protein
VLGSLTFGDVEWIHVHDIDRFVEEASDSSHLERK